MYVTTMSIFFGICIPFWIIDGKDCSIGFYGFQPDCKKCPYPSYGLKCQSICFCQKKTCNHVTGCFALIPDTESKLSKSSNTAVRSGPETNPKPDKNKGKNCSIGFYGFQPDCKTCPYPSYGLECQTICVCPSKTCNHVTGCSASMLDTNKSEGTTGEGHSLNPTFLVNITQEQNLDILTTESELMESNNCISDEIHVTMSTNRRERMSVLMTLIISVGCIGVLLIFIHIILFLQVHYRRPSNQYID